MFFQSVFLFLQTAKHDQVISFLLLNIFSRVVCLTTVGVPADEVRERYRHGSKARHTKGKSKQIKSKQRMFLVGPQRSLNLQVSAVVQRFLQCSESPNGQLAGVPRSNC